MRPLRLLLICLLASACAPIVATSAQNASALKQRLKKAAAQTSLTSDKHLKPWHLILEAQLFDQNGAPADHGTIEEWFHDSDTWRLTYAFPNLTGTEVSQAGKLFFSKDYKPVPPEIQLLLDHMEDPFDAEPDGVLPLELSPLVAPGISRPLALRDMIPAPAIFTPQFLSVTREGLPLDCILLTPEFKMDAPAPLGLFTSYCFDAGTNDLRLVMDNLTRTFTQDKLQQFHGHTVPAAFTITVDSLKTASVKVAVLADADGLPNDIFKPGPDFRKPYPDSGRVPTVVHGQKLSGPDPIYPAVARPRHANGNVTLTISVDLHGRVTPVEVLSAPDPDLALAAIAAVKQWHYSPTLVDGRPVTYGTIVTLHFTP